MDNQKYLYEDNNKHLADATKMLAQGRLKDGHRIMFKCPITGMREKAVLCKGHVVPKAAGGRALWVPQRKDVDNQFGSFANADFVQDTKMQGFVENPDGHHEFAEYLSSGQKLNRKVRAHVVMDGLLHEAQADSVSGKIHARLTGKTTAIDALPEPVRQALKKRQGEVGIFFESKAMPQVIVSCLHSFYLRMFLEHGYEVMQNCGVIRDILKTVYESNGKNIPDHARQLVRPNMVMDGLSEAFQQDVLDDPGHKFLVGLCGDVPFCTIHAMNMGTSTVGIVNIPVPFGNPGALFLASLSNLQFNARLAELKKSIAEIHMSEGTIHCVWKSHYQQAAVFLIEDAVEATAKWLESE